MNESNSPVDSELWQRWRGLPALVTILVAYVALRALAWANTILLDDHDSILYLQQIEAFRTFSAATIQALSPDVTPFYPFFGALLSLPGWETEIAARLCSLLFSVGLFFAAWQILKQVSEPLATALGLLTLTVSPFLIVFSISILSEPAYIAVIYTGFAYFLWQNKSSSLVHAAALGAIFGLGFLNRLEGLLFLVAIPIFQGLAYLSQTRSISEAIRPALRWSLVYVVVFVIIAAPQVLSVSDKMNRFALNGRVVWAELQLAPDAGSYEEEIYGLDHSPSEINLTYLQREPVQLPKADVGSRLSGMVETIARNIDKLYAMQIGKLGGSLLVAFGLFGLFSIYSRGLRLEALLIAGFLGATLVPGIITDPKPRAVAAAIPLLALLTGPGMLFLAQELRRGVEQKWLRSLALPSIVITLLAVWIVPFTGIYLGDRQENVEYSPDDLAPLQEIVTAMAAETKSESLTITSRKQYLAYFTESDFVPLPYAGYAEFIEYCKANHVDLLFLHHRLAGEYPFMQQILGSAGIPELEKIYESTDSTGNAIALYKLRYSET